MKPLCGNANRVEYLLIPTSPKVFFAFFDRLALAPPFDLKTFTDDE